MTEECIRKTKTVLNRLFDMSAYGMGADDITAEVLFHYYEYLRQNGYTSRKMYWDAQAARDTVADWRRMTDSQLPKTYEKNLLLSSLFSCEITDIVYTEYDGERTPAEFELAAKVERLSGRLAAVSLYLPRIRAKAGEKGDRFVMDDDMVNACYARVSCRPAADGLTLLDRAVGFIEAHGCRESAAELMKSLKAVYFNWLNGKTPSSLESLLLFSRITGLEINDLYKPIYEPHTFEIVMPAEKNVTLRKLKVSPSARRLAETFVAADNCSVVRCGADYVVTRNDADKYGILIADGDRLYYLDREYDYVIKDGGAVVTVSGGEIAELALDELPELEREKGINANVGFNPILRAAGLLKAAAFAAAAGRYACRRLRGGLLIVDKTTGSAALARKAGDGTLVRYDNGRPYYGMVREGVLVPPVYDERVRFSEGLFTVCLEGKYGFLNAFGLPIGEPRYEFASVLKEGRIAVKSGGKYGYADETGALTVDCAFDAAGDFADGLAAVTKDGKAGYVDADGRFVIEPVFDGAYRFSEGVAVVEKNGKFGYIDRRGGQVLPPIYDEATTCVNGRVQLLSCGRLIHKTIGGTK